MTGRRAPGGGRKPLPTSIKLLRGNPGKRGIKSATELEQSIEKGIPAPPRFLDATERRRWYEIGRELDKLGVLAKTDTGAMALLVSSRVRWERCARKVREQGEVLTDETTGRLYRNPWAIAMEKAWQQYRAMCIECGVTPSSRARVAPVAGTKTSPAAAAAGGGGTRDPFFGT